MPVEADDGRVVAAGEVGNVARLGVDESVHTAAVEVGHCVRVSWEEGEMLKEKTAVGGCYIPLCAVDDITSSWQGYYGDL